MLGSALTVEYLKFQGVFKDDKSESFFSDMMTGSRSLSEKQRSWFVSIISQQIKPFVLEHVEESMSLDMSDLNDTVLEI